MIFQQTDYRNILRSTFSQRQQRNASYSLRAFARDLKVSPSRLSEVINAGHKLSPATARHVASRLGLSESEQAYFADLVDSEAGPEDQRGSIAKQRIERTRHESVGEELTVERFEMVSNWYHFAILELMKLKTFRLTATGIASTLGVAKAEATRAIGTLTRLGYLKRVGRTFRLQKPRTVTRSATPSEAVRKFHRQILEKAVDALFFQTMSERASGSMIMAFDKHRLDEAQVRLDQFRRDFAADFAPKDPDSVYCLTVQHFRLDADVQKAVPPSKNRRN